MTASLLIGVGIGVGIVFVHSDWSLRLTDSVRRSLASTAPWLIWALSAYRAGSVACLILWALLIVGHMLVNAGLLPIAVVTVFWLVLTLSYSLKACQLECGRRA